MFTILALFALPLLTIAQLVPTAPGPGDVFKQGDQCTIQWTADASGKWKQTFIELMTGPNQAMVHLTTIATVDGTDPTKTSTSVPCPAVSPNSPIYFYQFTAQGQNATWTGRFAISDLSGATTPPQNAKQPSGENIPWGTGKLLTQGSRPPPTAPAGQVDGSGSGGAPAGLPASSSSLSQISMLSSATPSSAPLPTLSSLPSSSIVSQPAATSAAAPPTSSSTTNKDNGALHCHPSTAIVVSVVLIIAVAGLY